LNVVFFLIQEEVKLPEPSILGAWGTATAVPKAPSTEVGFWDVSVVEEKKKKKTKQEKKQAAAAAANAENEAIANWAKKQYKSITGSDDAAFIQTLLSQKVCLIPCFDYLHNC